MYICVLAVVVDVLTSRAHGHVYMCASCGCRCSSQLAVAVDVLTSRAHGHVYVC
jgi:predicted RNA-binding Zn-ribbon protein involved in translation (DUF1610 family)